MSAELFRLNGRVALVTGGSRGLGFQIAQGLGEMGCKVVITARKDEELAAAKLKLAQQGIEVATVRADLSDLTSMASVVTAAAAHFGTLDILVNNAGTTWSAPAEEHPDHAWHKVMDLNLHATYFLSREVARRFMIPKRSGKIIVVSSVAGIRSTGLEAGTVAYCTSKAGAIHLCRALAAEWGRYNINVNAVCPGFFVTRMSAAAIHNNGEALVQRTPLGRLGGDADLKGCAVFLASEASRHVTGQALVVDGGATLL